MIVVIGMGIFEYAVIFFILIILALAAIKSKKSDFKLEMNKLVEFLGGKDNIIETKVNESRFKATLFDVTKVNKEGIQRLGAAGIVEIDNQIKIVIGEEAERLKKYIDELK